MVSVRMIRRGFSLSVSWPCFSLAWLAIGPRPLWLYYSPGADSNLLFHDWKGTQAGLASIGFPGNLCLFFILIGQTQPTGWS